MLKYKCLKLCTLLAEYKAPFYRFGSDPVSNPDSNLNLNPDKNPDPKRLFRIRPKFRIHQDPERCTELGIFFIETYLDPDLAPCALLIDCLMCRSNQQAQADLQQLRQEIHDFVRSVLANPENKGKSLAARSALPPTFFCCVMQFCGSGSSPIRNFLLIRIRMTFQVGSGSVIIKRDQAPQRKNAVKNKSLSQHENLDSN